VATQRVKGLDGLAKALRADLKKVRRSVIGGVARAGRDTGHEVAQNVPVAFGELRGGIHVDTTKALGEGKVSVVSGAPHSAAVEKGARPHWMPLQPLIDWVKRRGAQGIDRRGDVKSAIRKAWGTTTARHAHRIATDLKQLQKSGRPLSGDHLSASAPVELARAIQFAIAKRGTKPHWFMKKQIGFARSAVDREVKAALKKASP
jgi:hypothetical protein